MLSASEDGMHFQASKQIHFSNLSHMLTDPEELNHSITESSRRVFGREPEEALNKSFQQNHLRESYKEIFRASIHFQKFW